MTCFRWILCTSVLMAMLPEQSIVAPLQAQEKRAAARVHPGGIGRYSAGRWALVGGTFSNELTDEEKDVTVVVMPPLGNGRQYGRTMTLPPGVVYQGDVPVYVPKNARGNVDFEYLTFADGQIDQAVQTRRSEQKMVQGFGASLGRGQARAASMDNENHPEHLVESLVRLNEVIRFSERGDETFMTLQLLWLSSQPELLEPLEHLSVSDDRLLLQPALMDSIRLWVQRGGRLVVGVNLSGVELWNGLFGSTAPMTLVQETSSMNFRLSLNPENSARRYSASEFDRSFDTPIWYLRTITENVEPIWSIDEWPVAVRLPFGKGEVIGLLIDADALLEETRATGNESPWKMIGSSDGRIASLLYKLPEPDLVAPKVALEQANEDVGYGIPSVSLPLMIALGFPVLLLAVGIWLLKKQVAERLIWLAPVLAIALAIPPMIAGVRQRSVAPPTVVDFRTVHAIPGQTLLAVDGHSVLYSPDSTPVSIESNTSARYEPPTQAGRREARRQVVTPNGTRRWDQISFPTGLTTIAAQSVVSAPQPLSAQLSFDEQGIVGQLNSGPFSNPRDLLLVGRTSERLRLQCDDQNQVSGTVSDMLALNSFVSGTLLSNEQNQHDAIYRGIFADKGRPSLFPEFPSVLYWADQDVSSKDINPGQDSRYSGKALIVQPVQWLPPALGSSITIPAAAIQYRSIAAADGKFSSPYSNQNREWVGREMATDFLLQFSIPEACLPLDATKISFALGIRAPSRKVILSAGDDVNQLTEFQTLESPLGLIDVQIPVKTVAEGLRSGKFVVKFDVSELQTEDDEDEDQPPTVGEQDDSWVMERVQMTVQGRRVEAP